MAALEIEVCPVSGFGPCFEAAQRNVTEVCIADSSYYWYRKSMCIINALQPLQSFRHREHLPDLTTKSIHALGINETSKPAISMCTVGCV